VSAAIASPNPSEWRRLAILGEQLASADSLSAQQDRILKMTRRLVDGRVSLWLDEGLFRLPDRESVPLFSPEPPSGGLRRAWHSGQVIRSDKKAKNNWISFPIADQGMTLGALQVTRADAFRADELDLLEGLSSIVAIGLYASHRAAVERFRLEQLNLVRQVSAQIANVLELDELARRVTSLKKRSTIITSPFSRSSRARSRFDSAPARRRRGRGARKRPLWWTRNSVKA
jgi:GAF domain-containing protein